MVNMKQTIFSKKINAYHSARWKCIRRYIKEYMHTQDNIILHKLRMEIKKTIALAHFLEFGNSAFKSEKYLRPLMKVFRLLGKQRDYYHAILFCEKFKIEKSVLKETFETPKSIFKKLKIQHKKYNKIFDKLETQMKEMLENTNHTILIKYLSQSDKKLKLEMSHSLRKTRIHVIRKQAKDILYLTQLTSKISSAKLKELDVLQDLMGKWHDLNKFQSMLKDTDIKIRHNKILAVKKEEQLLLRKIKSLTVAYH
jgi:CHAD domain-containing protein